MSETDVEEKMLVSSLLDSSCDSSAPHAGAGGEAKVRRRRRKPISGGGSDEKADGEKKRRLTDAQVSLLEMNFGKERKLESGRKVHLATELGLDPKQVAVWFQNRRARWKNKQLEEEYSKLKFVHDAILHEKCHLENEVLKLKTRLSEAEEKIRKLSLNSINGGSGRGSPSSSFSTATPQPPFGEFGLDGDTDMIFTNEYSNYMDLYPLWDVSN